MGEEKSDPENIRPMPPEENTILRRPPRPLYNWVSLVGAVFVVGSIFAFLLLFAIESFLPRSNPYVGLLVYVVAPVCFFAGVFLIVVGVWAQRSRRISERLQIDLSRPHDRKLAFDPLCAISDCWVVFNCHALSAIAGRSTTQRAEHWFGKVASLIDAASLSPSP